MTSPLHSPDTLPLHLAYLQAVVASMAQGISVFDQNLRLRVWNSRFIEVCSTCHQKSWLRASVLRI